MPESSSADVRIHPGEALSLHEEVSLLHTLAEQQTALTGEALARAAGTERAQDRIQEVHHRVRNHLQAVSGLLSAEGVGAEAGARHAFQQSIARLESVAAVHNLLAYTPETDLVDLAALLQELACHLLASAGMADKITLHCDLCPLNFEAKRAAALSLAVAELISNALEHAFPAGEKGTITLRLEREKDFVVLEVRDNGKGLDPCLASQSDGLGLGLVRRLVERDLAGSVQVSIDGGAVFRLTFPLKESSTNG